MQALVNHKSVDSSMDALDSLSDDSMGSESRTPIPAALTSLLHQVLPNHAAQAVAATSTVTSSQAGQQEFDITSCRPIEGRRGLELQREGSVFELGKEAQGTSLQDESLEEILKLLLQQHGKMVGCLEDCIYGHEQVLRKYSVHGEGHSARSDPGLVCVGLEVPELLEASEALKPREVLEAPQTLEILERSRLPSVLEDSEAIEMLESRRQPESFKVPETLEKLEVLEVPETPEKMKVLETINLPETFKVPEAPETSEVAASGNSLKETIPRHESKKSALRSITKDTYSRMSSKERAKVQFDRQISFADQMDVEDSERKAAAMALSNASKGYLSECTVIETKGCLNSIVNNPIFQEVFSLIVLTNAIIIGAETQYMASHQIEEIPLSFKITGWSFGFVFFVEWSVRIMTEGILFFKSHDRYWNWFDTLCVACNLVEVVGDVVFAVAGRFDNAYLVRVARGLRTLRLSRMVRIARVFRFVTALQLLVSSILSTLKSLIWALVLMFMLVYCFGVMFTQATTAHFVQHSGQHIEIELFEFWGSLAKSMHTLFQSATGGISWRDAITPLSILGWMWEGLFLAYISFTYFAVLNVVTGVFCNSAIDNAKHEPEMVIRSLVSDQRWYEKNLNNLFMALDRDKSGAISARELEKSLNNSALQSWFGAMGLEISDAWALFKLIDEDGSHDVSMQEFVSKCMQLRGNARSLDLALLKQDHTLMLKKMLHAADRIEQVVHKCDRELTSVAQQTSPRQPHPKTCSSSL